MKIGITYDLRSDYLAAGMGEEETAEFDRGDTIDSIESAIQQLGHATERIGSIKALAAMLVAGSRWDLVFNFAEGVRGFGREAQVPALLEAYDIPYTFSDPMVMSLTLHKGMTKHVLRDLGVPTPDFMVIEHPEDVEKVALPYPLFAKPVAEGTGKGVTTASIIRSPDTLAEVCGQLLEKYGQPVLVETYLPGREFTVGIVGTGRAAKSIGVMEVILLEGADSGVYSYRNKEICEEVVEYRLVNDEEANRAVEVALDAWRKLGCRDAGRVDLRSDSAAMPSFIEVNPLAGLHPEHSDLCIIASKAGISHLELMRRILEETQRRCNLI